MSDRITIVTKLDFTISYLKDSIHRTPMILPRDCVVAESLSTQVVDVRANSAPRSPPLKPCVALPWPFAPFHSVRQPCAHITRQDRHPSLDTSLDAVAHDNTAAEPEVLEDNTFHPLRSRLLQHCAAVGTVPEIDDSWLSITKSLQLASAPVAIELHLACGSTS